MKKFIFVFVLALSSFCWMGYAVSESKPDFYFPSKPCVYVYEAITWIVTYREVDNPFYRDPKTGMPKSGQRPTTLKVDREYWDTSYLHLEVKKILYTDSGMYYVTFLSNQKKEKGKKELLTGPDLYVKAYRKKEYASCLNLNNMLVYPMRPMNGMKVIKIDSIHTTKTPGYPSSSIGLKTKKRTYIGDETISVDGVKYLCHHFFEKYQSYGKIGIFKASGLADIHDIWIAEGVGLVKEQTSSHYQASAPASGRPNTVTLIKIYN